MNSNQKKVALLATGDEVLNGDITDGNGQFISQTLFNHNIKNGLHLICSDEQQELERSIKFLLEHHDALITTGGLGPTSDDRTRFALSTVTNQKLIFDDASWERIVARLNSRNIPVVDTNKQQALFPGNAIIFPNENGTASACEFGDKNKLIFMLPGPPTECLPLFERHVLPRLLAENFAQQMFRRRWLLQGIGEGNLAAQLDPLAEQFHCVIGYRAMKPKIELKIESDNEKTFNEIVEKIQLVIKPYIIS